MEENIEKQELNPEFIIRLQVIVSDGRVTNETLESIISSLERDGRRRPKKINKKVFINSVEAQQKYSLKNEILISYLESARVWRTWKLKEIELPCSANESSNKIFSDPLFNFVKVFLQGISASEMAKKYPNYDWGQYRKSTAKSTAGAYLISYKNELENLSHSATEELNPQDCVRLDFNLTIEFLITMHRLKIDLPEIYYRTTFTNGHRDEVCVGLIKGRLVFMSEDKARKLNQIATMLVKWEKWML